MPKLITNVYIDGFNLYYRALKGTPYRWLNVADLCRNILSPQIDTIFATSRFIPFLVSIGHGANYSIDAVSRGASHRLIPNPEWYYTALVRARPHNPGQSIRQQIYLRALRTIPIVEIHFGHFLSHEIMVPRADGAGMIKVIRESEKGSDVNLAAHLVRDGFIGQYEVAVILSNDTDLLEPIRIVREELRRKVGIICPSKHPSVKLLHACDFFKRSV